MIASYLGLNLGTFELIQGSLHAYENNFTDIIKLISVGVCGGLKSTPQDKTALIDQKTEWMNEYLTTKKLRMRS
jgi:hypothetical protein